MQTITTKKEKKRNLQDLWPKGQGLTNSLVQNVRGTKVCLQCVWYVEMLK